jgi:predicted DNA-binding protein with PD1-like motif
MFFSGCGHLKQMLLIELESGDDLLKKIAEVCEREQIKNGFVSGAVGALQRAAVFTAAPIGVENDQLKFGYMDEPLGFGGLLGAQTLNTVEGVICHDAQDAVSLHMHYSFTDPDGFAHGGHLPEGTLVLDKATVMIGVLEGIDMARRWDDSVNIFVFAPSQL